MTGPWWAGVEIKNPGENRGKIRDENLRMVSDAFECVNVVLFFKIAALIYHINTQVLTLPHPTPCALLSACL